MASLTQPSEEPNWRLVLQAEFTGKALIPLIVLTIYQIYHAFRYGGETKGFPHTYVLLAAAVLSLFVVNKYGTIVFREITPKPSLGTALTSFAVLMPYLLSLYVIGYLGVMPLVGLMSNGFSIGTLMFGLFWCAVGYRITYTIWLLSEVGRKQLALPQ